MSITIPGKPVQDEVNIDVDGRRVQLSLVGPSLRGVIYRSRQSGNFYRLIPLKEFPTDWQESICGQARTVAAGEVITPARDWRQAVDGVPHQIVEYPSAVTSRTMAECLTDRTPDSYVKCAAEMLRALPVWWQALYRPLFPFPADLVLGEDDRLRLLWVPFGGLPGADVILSHPQRVFYLSPELIRSSKDVAWDQTTWEAIDCYAVGVGLLQCYHRLPATDRLRTNVFRAANASLLDKLESRTDFPPWVHQFPTHHNTIKLVRRMTSPTVETRASVNLGQLANRLEQHSELFDPRKAVEQLRDSAKPAEALDLVQEVLPLVESLSIGVDVHYDLLRLAADLCEKYLRRPLDALDFYESAIAVAADRTEAYQGQMRMIANSRHHLALADLRQTNPGVAEDLKNKMQRNYNRLSGGRTHHAPDDEGELDDQLFAQYLLWEGDYAEAQALIFPRLSDKNGKYLWWDFELNLAYVHTFIGLETGDGSNAARAAEQLLQIKKGLNVARQNGNLDDHTAAQHGQEIAELERRLFDMGQRLTTSTPTE